MSSIEIIAFNKPFGVISQFSPSGKHITLKEYILKKDFYPAGRLDTDSEGLLLLTNNGTLQHKISHPKFEHQKIYYAQLEGIADITQLKLLEQGIALQDYIAKPAKIKLLAQQEINRIWERDPPIRFRKTVPDFWVEISINEGKNRQVRKMTAKIGYPCLRLIRVQIASINLFDLNLKVGEFKSISNAIF